jgi:hypothetical protein
MSHPLRSERIKGGHHDLMLAEECLNEIPKHTQHHVRTHLARLDISESTVST